MARCQYSGPAYSVRGAVSALAPHMFGEYNEQARSQIASLTRKGDSTSNYSEKEDFTYLVEGIYDGFDNIIHRVSR